MKPTELSRRICRWFDSSAPGADIVISSRIRLARNLAGFEFCTKLTAARRSEALNRLKDVILSLSLEEGIFFVDVEQASPLEQELLVERYLISRQHAHGAGPRGVVIVPSESFTAMINEEDHLRMQVFKPGLQLRQCWQQINRIDDMIARKLEYAFHPNYGYLTACPTNVGTGMRVSVMLHLPALKITGHIERFLNAAKDANLAVRGLFGEGTEALGDFFQLSNQISLGISEDDVVEQFSNIVVPKIVEYEQTARQKMMQTNSDILDDKIQRALGILRSARLISSQEALFLLSNIRMGVNLGRVEGISISTVNELFMLTQPAHLQLNSGQSLEPDRRDALRAQIIRSKLYHN